MYVCIIYNVNFYGLGLCMNIIGYNSKYPTQPYTYIIHTLKYTYIQLPEVMHILYMYVWLSSIGVMLLFIQAYVSRASDSVDQV